MNEKTLRAVVTPALAAVIFFACFSFGYGVGSGLDPSWGQVLGYAWDHHLQWGTEIVFTYGPYGAMAPGAAFDPNCYDMFLVVQFLLSLVLAAAAAYLTLTWRSMASVLLLLLICTTHAERGDWQPFLMYALSFVALRHYTACAPRGHAIALLAGATMVTCLAALIKFSYAPLWLLWLLCFIGTFAFRRQYWLCLSMAVSATVSFIVLWCAAHQDVTNIPQYFSRFFEIARGYGSAMSTPPDPTTLRAGLVLLVWVLLNLCWSLRFWKQRSDEVLLALFLAGFVLLGWKAGFTRADAHVSSFYLTAAATLILCHGEHIGIPMPRPLNTAASTIATLIALARLNPFVPGAPQPLWRAPFAAVADIDATMRRFLDLSQFRKSRLDQREDAARQADLPRIRGVVADASVDVYSYNQAAALLNRMNYSPRPVFQSYKAYSPLLAALNRNAVVGEGAPRYLLVQLGTIDGRLPTLDDSPALAEVLHRYSPLLVEHDTLLMQRQPLPSSLEYQPVSQQNAVMGESLSVPCKIGTYCNARMRIGLTLPGQIYSAFFGEPVLSIEVVEQSGRSASYRLTRGQADVGFLVRPFYTSTVDFAIAASGRDPHPLRSLSVHPQSTHMAFAFEQSMTVEFFQAPLEHREPIPAEVTAYAYPGFDRMPAATSGDVRLVDFDGRHVLLVHAPGEVEMPSTAAGRAAFDFGIANDAWSDPAKCPGTDGVEFSIVQSSGGDETRLFTRLLDPAHNENDRGPQHAELQLPANAASITFRTGVGPAGDARCDWAWIANVSISGQTSH